ncbi:patatin-like phospholipase family protein [Gimibacter soli]|uniref:Patatin-like phospholipase family protein n=1 Tax=Gimibacter soli TaxID=3024400 RepID=A0AAF0BLK1_9PROT|nr:patatin-like phospholipase family protein [Gimibacter soli]WCL53535.1 patatin-like phospholipase family protein [Gimibacter soli]
MTPIAERLNKVVTKLGRKARSEDTPMEPTAPKPTPEPRRAKVGLALGAGVARGWAHIGIARRLAEEGIEVHHIAGTSIGAVVGGAIAADGLDSLEDWARSLKSQNFFRFLDLKIGRGGLFGGTRLNKLMVENFGDLDFSALKLPFTAVACELKSGQEMWLTEGRISDSIQASFALPGVFEPVKINGRWLVDGALVNPCPVSVCRAAGCDMVIAVNLAEDLYGRRRATSAGALEVRDAEGDDGDFGVFADIMASPSVVGRKLGSDVFQKLFSRKDDAPSLFTNMVASLNVMQNRLSRSRLAGDPPEVTIAPLVGHVGLLEFHRADELIEEGVRAFDAQLAHIRDVHAIINHRLNA